MIYRLITVTMILSLVLFAVPKGFAAGEDLTGDEILLEVDRNLRPESYEMYRKLVNIEPDETSKEFILYTVKKGQDKMIALFLDPPSEKGRSTLRLEDNMWLYIPDVGKPIRITSLQSVVGGIFNNSDIMQLDFNVEYSAEIIGEETTEETYVLKLKAKGDSVAYDTMNMWVNKETLYPVKIEAYAASGMLIKTLHYKETKDFGNDIVRPSVIETDSPLYEGYKSIIIFAEITPKEFDDEVFTLDYMSRVEELR